MSKYDTLNSPQREAVYHVNGPLLILAGAGSGKTRVLTHRIAYLIEEKRVAPWNIMAITFTNKAAKEMRERVDKLIGNGGQDVWVSTFHSSCVRILRRHIDKIGYDRNFTIYDTDDSKKIIRECIKELKLDPKQYKESSVLSVISSNKNEMVSAYGFATKAIGYRDEIYAKLYTLYEKKLKNNNALDFGDLIFKTVELLIALPSVLEEYQNKFKYIMVDEYQDTNLVQFNLISLLAKKHENLCVVGDDDQSIYKFRGADIKHILNFETHFPKAKVIKLEQNYRSSGNILDCANHVIKNNYGRKVKRLWTDKEEGGLIIQRRLENEHEEAQFIASEIVNGIEKEGREYSDYAILYRTNAQSRVLEDKLVKASIPYKIIGGTSFYQRKEIKDILAYLKVVNNGLDDLAVKRIINVPRRGIGLASIDKVEQYANLNGINFYDALCDVNHIPSLTRAAKKITEFVNMIEAIREKALTLNLIEVIETTLDVTGYKQELEVENTTESLDRLNNIGGLISSIAEYEESAEEPTLNGFLEQAALVADIDAYEEDSNYVVLMTLHSAKGLEFPCVFLSGLEDGLFPSYMSLSSGDESDIEEERRLCYVGITRAMETLYITHAITRMVRGQTQYSQVSRFVKEIPKDLLDVEEGDYQFRQVNQPTGVSNPFFNNKPYQNTTNIPKPKEITLDYKEGDLVMHKKFGIGQVLKIEAGGADYQVTVNFPSVGVKKLLATLSGLKKTI
jgi:DNA helicase-2/ATP-dependent DNA helicase PcrA